MATSRSPGSRRAAPLRWIDHLGLVALAYLPALLSSPGRVSADSKQYLYLDPGAFLARIPYVWDAQTGAGGVSHQHIGYLWPMGPWFWALDAVGVPTWVAQRLWLGSLSLAAALGARWLLRRLGLSRAGALAGALVYLLTPYQLAFSARSSVLLLPWAALPWMVGLTDRAMRRGGWRDPAWLALLVLTVGAVNASTLILVGIGPVIWLLFGITDRATVRRAAGVAARVGALSVGVSLWWMAALRLEAAYGLPVLQVSERLQSVAEASTPSDVLRGLGNWFFYGRDRLGYSIDQAEAYAHDGLTVGATVALAALGVGAAVAVRWRHRTRFVALVLVGTVVSVGAWPLGSPSLFAQSVADFTGTSAGLALRNTARAAPVVVLGLAGMIGAAVSAWRPGRRQWGATALVGGLALLGFSPVASTGLLSEHQDRVDPVPSYWTAAADDLDDAGTATRVLEIPGSNFAAYRWGNAVDPILPGLMDRGQLAREILPQGSASSVLLLDALDRRIQEGTLEPDALAGVARLFGVGDIVLRSDLEFERFRTPNPRALWQDLTEVPIPGLASPDAYGDPVANLPTPELPMLDEVELRLPPTAEEPPPVARFSVEDPEPIVRVAPSTNPIVLAGDGDGIVDAAAAGLIDGRSLVLQATSLSERALRGAIAEHADLVITDTYRRRIQTWFYSIRDTRGPTEQAGETFLEPSGYDYRLDPTPWIGDDRRTVVEQVGGTVTATAGGGAERPEDRAASAVDGDVRTSWRVGGASPKGARLHLSMPGGVVADQLTLVQPQDGPRDRQVTRVRIRIDEGTPIDVDLTPASIDVAGQVVPFPSTLVHDLDLEITGVSAPPFDPGLANAVGFAEIRLDDVVVVERVRVPTDLLERADGGAGHGVDVVLTRLRYEPAARGRFDQERSLQRSFDLPAARAFGLSGTLRIEPNAPDEVLDEVLGTELAGAVVSASSHLAGDLGSRASRVLDGARTTAWQTAFGPQEGQHLTIRMGAPTAVTDLVAQVVLDDRHSVPGTLTLVADDTAVGTVAVPRPEGASSVSVALPDPPDSARVLRLEVRDVEARTAVPGDPDPFAVLPIGITQLDGVGLPEALDPTSVDASCRPLLTIDGVPVEVRAIGVSGDARRGLLLEPCGEELRLLAGSHTVASVLGVDAGIDVDRLVLSSGPDGAPVAVAPRGTPRADAGAEVQVRSEQRGVAYDLALETDGRPFWLVLGQSDNRGWSLDLDGAEVGPREVVDGYGNGWLVTPDAPGDLTGSLAWAPQRLIWVALGLSIVAVAICLFIVVLGRRRSEDDASAPAELVDPVAGHRALTPGVPGFAVAIGVATLLVSTPMVAAVASAAVLVGLAVPRATWVWLATAPALVLASRALERPRLAWLALALVAADLAVDRWNERAVSRRPRSERQRRAPAA